MKNSKRVERIGLTEKWEGMKPFFVPSLSLGSCVKFELLL